MDRVNTNRGSRQTRILERAWALNNMRLSTPARNRLRSRIAAEVEDSIKAIKVNANIPISTNLSILDPSVVDRQGSLIRNNVANCTNLLIGQHHAVPPLPSNFTTKFSTWTQSPQEKFPLSR